MGMPSVVKLILRNLKVNTDAGSLMILVGLPALYLVFFGFGFQSLIPKEPGSPNYLEFLAPGIVAFQTVIAGTVAGSMLWADRRWGMLAQLLVGPFTRLEYLLGIMLTAVAFGLLGAVVMIGAAYLLIGSLTLTAVGVLLILTTLVVGSILFGSLMLLLAALVKSNNAYNSIQILLLFVVNFASTVFYPEGSGLPLSIQILFNANPLTYVANTVRHGYLGTYGSGDIFSLGLLLAETVVFLSLAVWSYMRSHVSFV